jgi:hypothetical protein
VSNAAGKSAERPVLDEHAVERNVRGIERTLRTLLQPPPGRCAASPACSRFVSCFSAAAALAAWLKAPPAIPGHRWSCQRQFTSLRAHHAALVGLAPCRSGLPEPLVLNNLDWFGGMGLLTFLRDIGEWPWLGLQRWVEVDQPFAAFDCTSWHGLCLVLELARLAVLTGRAGVASRAARHLRPLSERLACLPRSPPRPPAGKYARVGTMLAKESVRKRMESEAGISYTEFTYQLLQVGAGGCGGGGGGWRPGAGQRHACHAT